MSEVKKEKKVKVEPKKKDVTKKETVKRKTTKKEVANESIKDTKIKSTKKKEVVEKKSKLQDEVLLDKKDQHAYTVLCKISRIITKIVKICLMILVPFVFLFMLLIPIVFKKVEINSNIIKINDVNIIIHDDSISLKVGDNVETFYCDTSEIDRITTFLMDSSPTKIAFLCEIVSLLFGVVIILNIYILGYIEKLLNNFEHSSVPFTDENTNYILKIAKLAISVAAIDLCISVIFDLSVNFDFFGILGILVLFVIYYIFKYATKMQNISNTKMCK